jgi:dienelactone hydrolase
MSCPECFSGHIRDDDKPRGSVTKVHGLDTYVSEPTGDRKAKGIIVIIPDAFGWEFVNNRLLADHFSSKGDYKVYLPNLQPGEQRNSTRIHGGTCQTKDEVLINALRLPCPGVGNRQRQKGSCARIQPQQAVRSDPYRARRRS